MAYSPPVMMNGGPRYQTLADLPLEDNACSSPGSMLSSRRSRFSSQRNPTRRQSDLDVDISTIGCGQRSWCICAAILALLMILSLICLSEGWLEALGLSEKVHQKDCLSPKFTKSTLKLLHEEPLQRLARGYGGLGDPKLLHTGHITEGRMAGALLRNQRAAGDLLAHLSGHGIRSSVDFSDYYVVFSNSFHVGKFSSMLTFHHGSDDSTNSNMLLAWPGKDIMEHSHFEAITYNASSRTWLMVQEAVHYNGTYVGNVWEVHIDPDSDELTPIRSCPCSYQFDNPNLGFNGVEVLVHPNGRSYLVGLCESNYCVGTKTAHKWGEGRLIVMELTELKDGACRYDTVSIASIPKEANFKDYTDFAIDGHNIAVVSQETSSIWIGKLDLVPVSKGVIKLTHGWIWDFPRSDACDIKYCNVKGISWEDSDKIVAVSSQMKGNGKQSFRCWEKAHSIASFSVNDKALYRPDEKPYFISDSSEDEQNEDIL